jgi:uncharacterized protein (DUF433 family)
MRKKVFFIGGLLALIIILGATHAYAQSSTPDLKHGHGWNDTVLSDLATTLNISPTDLAAMKTEVDSGKALKDVLAKHNITMDQVRAALATVSKSDHRHMSNTAIMAVATKLGLDTASVQADIEAGLTFKQILKKNNITDAQLQTAFAGMHPGIEKARSNHAKKLKS